MLAEYINNYPERSKLKVMFKRESEGVYQFGTKRIAIKVTKDGIKGSSVAAAWDQRCGA